MLLNFDVYKLILSHDEDSLCPSQELARRQLLLKWRHKIYIYIVNKSGDAATKIGTKRSKIARNLRFYTKIFTLNVVKSSAKFNPLTSSDM